MNAQRCTFWIFCLCFVHTLLAQQPHIVIVIVDDVGFADIGYNNPEVMITPFIDSLSQSGIRLSNYYAHPTCTPSRGALMTGRFSHNFGLPFPLIGSPAAGLPEDIPILPEILHQHNYSTHLVGKWHLGHAQRKMTPTNRGFDTFYGLHGAAFHHYKKSVQQCVDLHNGTTQILAENVNETEHSTVDFTKVAVNLIEKHQVGDKPKFLVVAYSAAHDPLYAEADDMAYCTAKNPNSSHRRRLFCALVRGIDRGMETIVASLKAKNMWDDTIFIFTSDNGGLPASGGYNHPFRGFKSSAWEGGIRVPSFLVAHPRFFGEGNRTSSEIFHIADWAPTLLNIINHSSNEKTFQFDGQDMRPLLLNSEQNEGNRQAESERMVVLQHDIFMNVSAVRKGDLKLILGSPGLPWLFSEPTTSFRHHVTGPCSYSLLSFPIFENLADWWEDCFGTLPIIFTVLGYVANMQGAVVADYFCGTSYRNFLHADSRQIKQLRSECLVPALEWSQAEGPRVFLFNISSDISESHNLAYEHPAIVENLYQEFVGMLQNSPIQYAGDAIDSVATGDAYCGPWIPDSADLTKYDTINERFFVAIAGRLNILFTLVLFAVVAVPTIFLCVSCALVKRRSRRKHETKPKRE